MTPHNLEEFAQELRRKGDFREVEIADEILALIDIEEEVAEPYSELCGDLEHYAPDGLKDKPAKVVEWLGDRSQELDEVRALFSEEELSESGVADAMRERLDELEGVTDILKGEGWDGDGDLVEALRHTLASWPPKMEYDL